MSFTDLHLHFIYLYELYFSDTRQPKEVQKPIRYWGKCQFSWQPWPQISKLHVYPDSFILVINWLNNKEIVTALNLYNTPILIKSVWHIKVPCKILLKKNPTVKKLKWFKAHWSKENNVFYCNDNDDNNIIFTKYDLTYDFICYNSPIK